MWYVELYAEWYTGLYAGQKAQTISATFNFLYIFVFGIWDALWKESPFCANKVFAGNATVANRAQHKPRIYPEK